MPLGWVIAEGDGADCMCNAAADAAGVAGGPGVWPVTAEGDGAAYMCSAGCVLRDGATVVVDDVVSIDRSINRLID